MHTLPTEVVILVAVSVIMWYAVLLTTSQKQISQSLRLYKDEN